MSVTELSEAMATSPSSRRDQDRSSPCPLYTLVLKALANETVTRLSVYHGASYRDVQVLIFILVFCII